MVKTLKKNNYAFKGFPSVVSLSFGRIAFARGFCIFWVLAVLFTSLHGMAKEKEPLKIRKIIIYSSDVFGDRKNLKWYHTWFQAMHIKTRQSVIKRELLFKTGDTYDPELIAESERILRKNFKLSDAYIRVNPVEGTNLVDIDVVSVDRFTLRISFGFSHKGGISKWRASVGESNFFGLQKSIHFTQEKRSDGNTIKRYSYNDHRFLKKFSLSSTYSQTDEGIYQNYEFGKPFRTLHDQHEYFVTFMRDGTKADIYQDGGVDLEIPQNISQMHFVWSKELGDPVHSKRLSLKLAHDDFEYFQSPVPLPLPDNYKDSYFMALFNSKHRSGFEVLQNIDSMIFREDIEQNLFFTVGAGFLKRENFLEKTDHFLVSTEFGLTQRPSQTQLVSARATSLFRFSESKKLEQRIEAFIHYYYFHDSQTFLAGMVYESQILKDVLDIPLTLGEDNGLRGYPAFYFTGEKLLLLNLEHRWLLPFRSKNWAFSQIVFMDGGNAWKSHLPMALGQLNWSAGLGLRVGSPSFFGKKIGRIDIAWPLNDPNDGYSISASVGQIFNHNRINEGFSKDF